jgi:autotransporter-associated beta strand protein
MKIKRFGLIVLVGLVLVSMSVTDGFAQSSQRPNVVVLFSDDAGYADFGFMDQFTGKQTEFKTPNLDQLSQQGATFSDAYVSGTVCAPSRAGLLTGRYQQRFGFEYNISNRPVANDGLPTDQTTMMRRFQQMGYTTGTIGKWHQGSETAKQPQNRGVDEFFGLWGGARPYFGQDSRRNFKLRRGASPVQWTSETSDNNIPNDPELGRHVTDAFGDEATKFISNHAGERDPFFMYMPFTSPHGPYSEAKQQDLAKFDGTSLSGTRKNTAALVYAMDRAVGNVLDRLEDPNRDGDTSDSVADNTVVVFLNDNGGAGWKNGTANHDNGPLRGWKSSAWEGGIRVPMVMRGPGVDAGHFNDPVSSLDLFPTLVAASGGEMTTPTDGVNLLPFLDDQSGSESGDQLSNPDKPHDALYWRQGGKWAVRKGDWKLVKGKPNKPVQLVELKDDGSGEWSNLADSRPNKYSELKREFVSWEVTLDKPRMNASRTTNRFDHFRFRFGIGTDMNWSDADAWRNHATGDIATMQDEDGYANTVLEFHPKTHDSYTATNDLTRVTGFEFMANQIRFDGSFHGDEAESARIDGKALMLVETRDGEKPVLALNSDETTSNDFTFNADLDLVLYDDLTIAGDDTDVTYNVNGQIREFHQPRGVTKMGLSRVSLTGHNSYSGPTNVREGQLVVDGAEAALEGTTKVVIGESGMLSLSEGLIRTATLDNSDGGTFAFTGGRLETAQVVGDLTNDGGTFAPGQSPAITEVLGNYTQKAGTLSIEINGTTPGSEYDRLIVEGDLVAGGTLTVEVADEFDPTLGTRFESVVKADAIEGQFDEILGQQLADNKHLVLEEMGDGTIDLVTVPEPLSAGYLALGAAALLSKRRQSR